MDVPGACPGVDEDVLVAIARQKGKKKLAKTYSYVESNLCTIAITVLAEVC